MEMSKNWAGLIMVGAALGLSSAASAAIISFENPPGPGHFDWNASAGHDFLNLVADAASQPGVSGAVGTFRRRDIPGPPAAWNIAGATTTSRIETIVRNVPGAVSFLSALDFGTPIPTPIGPDVGGFGAGGNYFYNSDPGFSQTEFPEGAVKYLGVRVDLDAGGPLGFQYGWIGVVRTGTEVDAFAWAYETEVGVPIAAGAVPEPASLSLLLIGGVALLRRRRSRA